jgi:hypothetical protein
MAVSCALSPPPAAYLSELRNRRKGKPPTSAPSELQIFTHDQRAVSAAGRILMANFDDLVPKAGVDAAKSYMVVGRDRYNVVVLQDAAGFRLLPNHKLEVKEISARDILSNVISVLLAQFGSWNLKDSSNAKAFSDALTARFSKPDARLLLVKGKIKGATRLEASHGKQKIGINVFVLPPKSISVAFRFVKVSDSAGNPLDTVKDASQNQALLNVLNWTFAPQANVSFDLADTDTVKITLNRTMEESVNALKNKLWGKEFEKTGLQSRSKKAALTVFFVKDYLSRDDNGMSETFWPPDVACVVADAPKDYVVDGEDPFEIVFAHEVCHVLQNMQQPKEIGKGTGHHKRDSILMCENREGAKIDEPLMKRINKA